MEIYTGIEEIACILDGCRRDGAFGNVTRPQRAHLSADE